ncbi:NAD(P)-binding domain-containing protein [Bradyrhizobium sp.]|uniref:NAD(P)-binding domain-containing protein n=1 Tax=Bradyrhizobium sp. TaxID=376 RepID=UPI002D5988E3|nr:NAD(P)-binding domain-containing protein [Bradyrhizobium sp.]HZR74298.1 NAD(P)-binding domain-containing protein [Bradyrhizobium sp.]
MSSPQKTIAIIGGGPVGLAAAAHALERDLTPIILEAGNQVGQAVREWSHVRMFSPWTYNVDKAAERLLRQEGWNAPDPDHYPTGAELVEHYLEPLATRTPLSKHIRTNARAVSVGRIGFDKVKTDGRERAPFEVRYQNGKGPQTVRADAVIDASGTWRTPNPAGSNGLAAIGEMEHASLIAYGMPDVLGGQRYRYAGKVVAVLGAGHSAVGTILDLAKLKEAEPLTQIVWLLRSDSPEKSFGGGANDKLAARGELGRVFRQLIASGGVRVETGFRLTHITATGTGLRLGAGSACCGRHVEVEELIVSTGFRPDLSFLRELRISLDPALECPFMLAPLIDPNEHSCGTVRPHGARELAQPEPGFYFAGMKSYGRAPTFLMMTGYEQVRSIIADIVGDKEAAERVELVLPETGVCSRPLTNGAEAEGCCGGPAPVEVDACCKQDAEAKAAGAKGCGCS